MTNTRGFSLLELTIVLVFIGLLTAVGVGVWLNVMEGRGIAKTRSTMTQIKECLVKRAVFSDLYPSYSAGGQLNCTSPGNNSVDACLCETGMKDYWGGDIYFLDGLYSPGTGLNGARILDRAHQGVVGVQREPGPQSALVDEDGKTINDLAFALISFGKDKTADHFSYGDLFDPSVPSVRAAYIGAQTPDFNDGHVDDIVVYVTRYELVTSIEERW